MYMHIYHIYDAKLFEGLRTWNTHIYTHLHTDMHTIDVHIHTGERECVCEREER